MIPPTSEPFGRLPITFPQVSLPQNASGKISKRYIMHKKKRKGGGEERDESGEEKRSYEMIQLNPAKIRLTMVTNIIATSSTRGNFLKFPQVLASGST